MKPVRAVERALAILFLVAESDHPLGLSEISRELGFDKATALRLLGTLEQSNLVLQDPATRLYMLGINVSRLTRGFRTDLRSVARPVLESLWQESHETVCLNCARGVARIIVDVIPADHEFSIVPAVGSALPIHLGASGKALMAFFPPETIDRIIRACDEQQGSEYAVTDVEELLKQLRATRRKGFAWSIGDVFPGSAAVAAPVFDQSGNVAASLTLRGPQVRLSRRVLLELAPTVKNAADRLSLLLGYEPAHSRNPSLQGRTAAHPSGT
ncbi:MAG TPA: IclR family transcriptional regulator [Gammaproteobacteria bacterium]